MIYISDAIHILSPGSRVIVREESLDMITWTTGNPKGITKEQIQTKLAELQAGYDAQAYARKREAEYPTIQELVVALYDTDDKSAIEAKRAAIKAKYPKG